MKEIEDITEAAQLFGELYEELKEINEGAKEYLEDYIKNNNDEIKSIEEYESCVNMLGNMFELRIYDLAQYNLTNELLNKIKG